MGNRIPLRCRLIAWTADEIPFESFSSLVHLELAITGSFFRRSKSIQLWRFVCLECSANVEDCFVNEIFENFLRDSTATSSCDNNFSRTLLMYELWKAIFVVMLTESPRARVTEHHQVKRKIVFHSLQDAEILYFFLATRNLEKTSQTFLQTTLNFLQRNTEKSRSFPERLQKLWWKVLNLNKRAWTNFERVGPSKEIFNFPLSKLATTSKAPRISTLCGKLNISAISQVFFGFFVQILSFNLGLFRFCRWTHAVGFNKM